MYTLPVKLAVERVTSASDDDDNDVLRAVIACCTIAKLLECS